MSAPEIATKVEKVFRSVFGARTPYSPALSRINEERWTSLKHVEFIIALEAEFGIRFDGADATDMTSIPIVLERVESRLM